MILTATYTTNLSLKLPDYSDRADVGVINDNFKKIDDFSGGGKVEEWLDDIQKKADESLSKISQDATTYLNSIQSEVNESLEEIQTEASESLSEIENKANNALASIPDDYETIYNDVSSLKDQKAPAIEVEASGSILTIPDAAAQPAMQLISHIVPVQAGSGDPSPENVRPISGWDAVSTTRTKKNLFGGDALADKLVSLANATKDEAAGTVTFAASTVGGDVLFDKFKPNTRYTFIFYGRNTNLNLVNLQVRYTDGSAPYRFFFPASAKDSYIVWTSPDGKTIENLHGINLGYNTILYYDKCGIFEGVLNEEDFEEYIGQTLSAALPETVYGGTLDWKSGVLTVDGVLLALDGTEAWGTVDGNTVDYFYLKLGALGTTVSSDNNTETKCSHFAEATSISTGNANTGFKVINSAAYNQDRLIVRPEPTFISTVEEWKAYLAEQAAAGTPVQACYQLAQSTTIQLTPQQLDLLKGQNNVWSNCGDTSIVYVADTKMYIDSKISELVTLALAEN